MKDSLIARAIRSSWAVARAVGIEPLAREWPEKKGLMSERADVRRAMVRAWMRGYASGKSDARQDGGGA